MAGGVASLPALNLPRFEFELRKRKDQLEIRDPLRQSWLVWTPEEWVRQHFCQYLVHHLGYPAGRISLERSVKFGARSGRYDMVVYNEKGNPAMLIECKAPSVKLDETVLNQAVRYAGTINAERVAITNGMKHFCFVVDERSQLIQEKQWPSPGQL